MVLDVEPHVFGNSAPPRSVARILCERFVANFPDVQLYVTLDSAFGSIEDLHSLQQIGVRATMSVSSNIEAWLWELLLFKCPLDSGRMALYRGREKNMAIIAAAQHSVSNSGKFIDLRTITTCFDFEMPDETETRVTAIKERIIYPDGRRKYRTLWADGDVTIVPAENFLDMDGTFTRCFLERANKTDLLAALSVHDVESLQEMCRHLQLRVPSCMQEF